MVGNPEAKIPVRCFLDTSALFAGVLSPTGAARPVLQLAEAGVVQLVISRQVLLEAESTLRRKAPEALGSLALLLDRARVEICATASPAATYSVSHPGDAQIVADAYAASVSFLLSFDREHLVGNQLLQSAVPYRIGTPGDFISWLRAHCRRRGQGDQADNP